MEKARNLSHEKKLDLNISNKRSWPEEWITQYDVRRKVERAAPTTEKYQQHGMEDGHLIPQLTQQMQFIAKVGNFLNSHLSSKSPQVLFNSGFFCFFQTHLYDTREGETAQFILGKWIWRFLPLWRGNNKEGWGYMPKLSYQSPVRRTTWCSLPENSEGLEKKENDEWNSMQDVHKWDRAYPI